MTNEQNRPPLARGDITHFAQALFLKIGISDRENFVPDVQQMRRRVEGHVPTERRISTRLRQTGPTSIKNFG